ncbi:MAG: hypothetical protein GWN13_12040 [Phycisphaerae bacterium]|nr:hypothetical protein [Phycisphaerae bacterium]
MINHVACFILLDACIFSKIISACSGEEQRRRIIPEHLHHSKVGHTYELNGTAIIAGLCRNKIQIPSANG